MLFDDDGEHLPSKFEVCSRCEGNGTHTNPAIDGNGITGDEMAEIMHDDPEFPEKYQSGHFDVVCQECHGKRVIEVPDFDRMSGAQIADWEEKERQLMELRAEEEAERRVGA